ncbi:MAG TPA: TIGR02266 family protein, partial [Myxococcaceae bacterium]|nr:TIGR02266 family protein [Myxococcaceae bacterium]
EQALVALQEAVGTRTRMAEKLRQQIRAHTDELTRLEKQLAEHDTQLQEHLVRADLERARKERERKEERERERARERAMAEDAAAAAKRTEAEMPAAAPTVATGRSGPKQSPAAAAAAATANLLSERQSRVRMQASVDMESESNFFQGFSTNLSEGGLFVATVQMLPRGTPVDLHFTLPGGKRIDAKGVVRWTREVNDRTPDIFPGVGVQFTDLPTEAAAAIRSFVSEREPLFFAD